MKQTTCNNVDSAANSKIISKLVAPLLTDGTRAGEECIAAADYLHCPINLYKYFSSSDMLPVIYCPKDNNIKYSPIFLAFYEPGHYKSVINVSQTHFDNFDCALNNIPVFDVTNQKNPKNTLPMSTSVFNFEADDKRLSAKNISNNNISNEHFQVRAND